MTLKEGNYLSEPTGRIIFAIPSTSIPFFHF